MYSYQSNILPQQQIIQANGKASIDALRMMPNSSVLIMDTTAPIVWMCVSDGLGNVTSTPYDIAVHKDPEPININDLDARLAAIEKAITNMEVNYGKSDAFAVEQRNDGEFITNQANVGNGQKRRKSTSNATTDDAE